MRLIAHGIVDREGVQGLAARLGYTARQLQRLLHAETGTGPLALARAQRAQTARRLIETTAMPFGDIAYAAGFSSIRQFNDTLRVVYDSTPTRLRLRATATPGDNTTSPGIVSLRLPVRAPFAYAGVFGHLAASVVPGCEEVRDGAYRRTLRLPFGKGIASLAPTPDHVRCTLVLDDFRDLTSAVSRCRRLLDLDADPDAVIDALSSDAALAPVIHEAPGQRIPRTVDEAELAVRTVLGQQVSIKAARTHAGRLVAAYGEPVHDADGALTHTFPTIEQLSEIDPAHLAMPQARRRTVTALIAGLADGSVVLDPGCDWAAARSQLLAVPGIGPWTAEVIAMRGLGDPDAFPASDLGLRLAAEQLGLPSDQRALIARSGRWRPWRSYATQHLWTTLEHEVNQWPPKEAA
jgi:AraC family transcriptional regulator of adaptative response / DNA-3-methyladenine glycosylase II